MTKRICGPCRACCVVFPIPVLEKPPFEPCSHLCAAGCGVYRNGQPQVCIDYSCWWLDHEEAADHYRPDLTGMVVTESGTITVKGHEPGVLVATLAEPGAALSPRAQELVDRFVAAGRIVLIVDGADMRPVYDRERYRDLGPEEIEAAFQFERMKDAEELRRLGAIGGKKRKPGDHGSESSRRA